MELRQVEYFVAVADEANFTRAAARMRVAQPAVSAQIQRLERDLGEPLFDRSRRKVRLTAAGVAALPHAREVLAAVGQLRRAVEELTGVVRGAVTIGTVTSHNADVAGLLADFHAEHPGVEITLTADNSDALVDSLRAGRLDLAIVSIGADEHPDGLGFDLITDERIVAAVAVGHPLADRRILEVAELHGYSMIALPTGTGIRNQFDAACAAVGVAPRIAFEAGSPTALAELAERGLGVAVLPESLARARPGLHALTFTPALRGRLVLAWRASGPTSPAARVLITLARRLLPVGVGA